MESLNIEMNLGMPGSPTGAETVSEPPGPEVLGNTSDSGVIELPKHKQKWTQDENRKLWLCYVESEKHTKGYMKRMRQIWDNKGGRSISMQKLRTQVQNIERLNLLSEVERGEIESIARVREVGAHHGMALRSRRIRETEIGADSPTQMGAAVCGNVRVAVDRSVDVSCRDNDVRLLTEEEKQTVQRLRELMTVSEKTQLTSLKKVKAKELKDVVEHVNGVIHNVKTNSITEMNNLIYAGAFVVTEKLGKTKKSGGNDRRNEPWWKRRIEGNIKKWRKDISRLTERRGNAHEFDRRDDDRLAEKYHIEDLGNVQVIDRLKAKIAAGATKIKRFDERQKQHHQNALFSTNQKKFYEELDGRNNANIPPHAEEATEFWKGIWSVPGKFNDKASWLPKVKEKLSGVDRQADVKISICDVKKAIRKMTNWKAPGPDCVQGYWFKRFTSLHDKLTKNLQDCMTTGETPEWLTKGKTALVQKDPAKGNIASNYRPIACLPLMWKLLTSVLTEKVYTHLAENKILPDEQKGCRKASRGTKDQLLIDREILKHCRKHQRNLSMGWIDYKKAYDMVPHSWMIEAMKMVGVAGNILELFEKSKDKWKTELTACGEGLGEVDIRRGIFQGDSFSPLLFVIVLIPLSIILNETGIGYETSKNERLNHLLFMDDLKLYAKNERELDSLIQTVRVFSDDIDMVFGLEKCAVLVLKRGRLTRTEGIELPDGQKMKEVDVDGYKYLGVLQLDGVMNTKMKEKVRCEYIRRVKKLLRSQLNGGNVITGLNAWAVGVVRYGAGILEWTKGELKEMDIKTRKLMTMNGCLHPRSNVGRLYLPRKEGGRGLISCEDCVKVETQSLDKYVSTSEEWMLKFVAAERGLTDVEETETFKKQLKDEKKSQWLEKPLHGKFVRDTEGVGTKRNWQWLNGGHLKKETEALIFAAQDQALRVNAIKHNIDRQEVSPICRMCGETNETVMHLSSGCAVLAKSRYKIRHDTMGKHIHWLLLKKYGIPVANKWYEHVPQVVTERADGKIKVYWDKPIKTDRKVKNNRPDVVVVDYESQTWYIVDFAVPMDHGVKTKEDDKVDTYMDLAAEVRRQFRVKTVIVPIVVGALGTVPQRLEKYLEKLEIPDIIGSMQTAVLLSTSAILRRVLNL